MKTRQLILGLCCLAAMASCSNDEPLAEVPALAQEVTLTLSSDETADTRTTFEAKEGGGLTHVWAEGDKIRLSNWDNGTEVYGVLTLASGAGTNTATFTGTVENWADGETKGEVRVVYGPFNSDYTKMDWSTQNGKLENLGQNEVLMFRCKNMANDGGKLTIGEISLSTNDSSLFFCLPEGLKLLDSGSGSADLKLDSGKNQFAVDYTFNTNGWTRGYVTVPVTLEDGKLNADVYIAAVRGWNANSIKLTFEFDNKTYEVTLNKSFSNCGGQLFTITQEVLNNAGGFKEVS